jgi:hypothetical protein
MIEKWFMNRGVYRSSSMSTDRDTVYYHDYWKNTKVAEEFKDGFILINLDLMAMSFKWSVFWNALGAISDRSVPISFSALKSSGVRKEDLEVIYRGETVYRRWNRECNKMVFRIANTERVLINLKDSHWAGLVEPAKFCKTYEEAVDSLIPDEVKSCDMASSRHGDWYFIPRPEFKKPRGAKVQKWAYLDTEKHHTVRDLVEADGSRYVRGTARHRGGNGSRGSCSSQGGIQRPMLSLGNIWHEVVKSKQMGSWAGYSYWS